MTTIEQEILEVVRGPAGAGERLNNFVDQFRSGRDVHDLLPVLDATDAELVSIGTWILGELRLDLYNSSPFISRLRALVEHQTPVVRFHAFGALFPALDWQDDASRLLLAKLRRDPDEGVRRIATAAAERVPSN